MSRESIDRDRENSPKRVLAKGALLACLTAAGAAAGAAAEGAKLGSLIDASTGGTTLGIGTVAGGLLGFSVGLFGILATGKRTVRVEGGDRPVETINRNYNVDVARLLERRPHPGPRNEAFF